MSDMEQLDSPALDLAVAKFNSTFGYKLKLPASREALLRMAEIAHGRGRVDLADALRSAVLETLTDGHQLASTTIDFSEPQQQEAKSA